MSVDLGNDAFPRTPNGASDLLDVGVERGPADPAGERICAQLDSFEALLDEELRDLERYGVGGADKDTDKCEGRSDGKRRRKDKSKRKDKGKTRKSARRVVPRFAQVTAKTASIMSDYRAFLSELHAEDAVADTELGETSSSSGSEDGATDGAMGRAMATEALLSSVDMARDDVRHKYDDDFLARVEEGSDDGAASYDDLPDPPSPTADPEELLWKNCSGGGSSPEAPLDGGARRRYRRMSSKARRGIVLFAAAAALVALSAGTLVLRVAAKERAEADHLAAEIEEEEEERVSQSQGESNAEAYEGYVESLREAHAAATDEEETDRRSSAPSLDGAVAATQSDLNAPGGTHEKYTGGVLEAPTEARTEARGEDADAATSKALEDATAASKFPQRPWTVADASSQTAPNGEEIPSSVRGQVQESPPATGTAAVRDPVEDVPNPYAAAVMRYRPVRYDRSSGWTGTSYRDALEFCRSTTPEGGMARDVCPAAAVCPMGTHGEPLGGYRDVDGQGEWAWIPVIDDYNRWVQGGSRERCEGWSRVHAREGEGQDAVEDENERGPGWGETGEGERVEEMTSNVMCCINAMM